MKPPLLPASIVALAFLMLAGPVVASENASAMDAEIDRLLAEVRSSDCVFLRNGDEHDAGAAAEHLAMKRRRGSRYFDSSEEFIERIASKSSWSGKPYRIRCGGNTVTAATWFAARLAGIRAER